MERPALALVLICSALALLLSPAHGGALVLFEDDFNGASLDSLKWRTEDLTEGRRWCDESSGALQGPGGWISAGSGSCHGLPVAEPFGIATLADGNLTLAASLGRAFPYLCTRNLGGVSPFPAVGDFVLTIRMRYNTITAWGDGVIIRDWASTEPEGSNAPGCDACTVLQVWADGSGLTATSSLSGSYQWKVLPNATAWHEYVVRCEAGVYTISVDGQTVFGPIASSLLPTVVWLGNPVFSHWGSTTWTSFSVDCLRIEATGVTPASHASFGSLKNRYR